jgi:hypothetical protein
MISIYASAAPILQLCLGYFFYLLTATKHVNRFYFDVPGVHILHRYLGWNWSFREQSVVLVPFGSDVDMTSLFVISMTSLFVISFNPQTAAFLAWCIHVNIEVEYNAEGSGPASILFALGKMSSTWRHVDGKSVDPDVSENSMNKALVLQDLVSIGGLLKVIASGS